MRALAGGLKLQHRHLFSLITSDAHMKIIDNKALEIVTRYPDRITTIIPDSGVIDSRGDLHKVLVRWTLDAARVLNNMGFKAPSPIHKNYNWPGLYKPFDHQKETAAFLSLNKRAYVLNDMGTGKTCSVSWAMDYLMTRGLVKRALVICPLSIMRSAWVEDMFRTVMHRTVGVAHGSKEAREKVINGPSEVVVINFDGTKVVHDALMRGGFDLIIIDEATAVKRAGTDRWKLINSLITEDSWLWLMTGTPAAQSPVDAYGLIKMMHPHKVDRTEYMFKERVMYKVTQFRWLPKTDANEFIHKLMQPAIRYTKEDCLDLPDLLYQTRVVPLTAQQQKYYDKLKNDMLIELSSESVTTVNAAANMNKLLQLASGAAYTDTGEVIEFDMTSRYNELCTVIDDSSHSVLVFATFRHSIERLMEKLSKDGYEVDCIHGGVSLGKRTSIFDAFQTCGRKKVLVIQPQSASHGVTLHAANTVIWWSPTTSYETYAQANARVHRAGQKNPCCVVHLQGCPVEAKLYAALQDKETRQIDLLGMYSSLLG
jgi:SNF2 family DNA or RNA helicase